MPESLPSLTADAKPSAPEVGPSFRVSVRTLAEFTGRSGDLDRRFGAAPTGRQGIAAHHIVAQRRSPGHEFEVAVDYSHGPVRVVGRIDIFDPQAAELEEVKSGFGPPGRRSITQRATHWAQLRIYGAMVCAARGIKHIRLTLVHFDLLDQSEHRDSEDFDSQSLIEELQRRCDAFADWAQQELAHRADRDIWLSGLGWPMREFREGQRELAAAVYRATRDGELLRLQAPTGIGKTLGTLYPALRSMPKSGADRLFYLTAKGTGRQAAVDAIDKLLGGVSHVRPELRVVEIVSRERACEHPSLECHGESCPLARGFFDRLAAARAEATQQPMLDRARLRALALKHSLCPYFFSTEIVSSADLVIGDYNYWFDRHALLFGLTLEHDWKVTLLIDEAHHLIDRSRAMYSADLRLEEFIARLNDTPGIERIIDQWDQLHLREPVPPGSASIMLDSVPIPVLRALTRWIRLIARRIEAGHPVVNPETLGLYFRCLTFLALAEAFDEHSLCELLIAKDARAIGESNAAIYLHNIVPACFLRERLNTPNSMILFSATLHPEDLDQSMLGWTRAHRTVQLPSPFDPKKLRVRTVDLSTQFDRRRSTIGAITEAIGRQYRETPGCYIAFFSSFEYLEIAAETLRLHQPDVPIRAQHRSMSDGDRKHFVAGFDPRHPAVALAVLGGVFAEGMDLPGDRLIGAFIVTLGMPQVNPLNEATAARLDVMFGRGFEFTYLYPGVAKVVQAAGRVIRDAGDYGTVLLIDERWSRPRYRALLPAHWGLNPPESEPEAGHSLPRPPVRPSA